VPLKAAPGGLYRQTNRTCIKKSAVWAESDAFQYAPIVRIEDGTCERAKKKEHTSHNALPVNNPSQVSLSPVVLCMHIFLDRSINSCTN